MYRKNSYIEIMREHTNYEAEFDEEKVKFAKTITNKEM